MGIFDSVIVRCFCGGEIEFQSKAGECILQTFEIEKVPRKVAIDISGNSSVCNKCNKEYMISTYFKILLPECTPMRITEVG